ncbi:MAG: selenocysteine-specific translation elongation factor [Anaerolineae bacterium]|nr:selenocysteine-specific translation elongation factor [Anaerolineae bacterium]
MASEARYRVVATAGHVDHGKSTLVKALTGVDPDRLREEQERQMTIDLGFGWLELPSGTVVGIVDVPGHRDFVHNMLAGVGGIDAVLLVVAADEGIMPQTREHLAILDLLRVETGLVVITKADLVDLEWLELVREDVREGLMGSTLAGAPIHVVSATTGAGVAELVAALDRTLARVSWASDEGRPRLPIDRVFTLRGHGTVVTGTLTGGTLSVGDQATIQPSGARVRVRALQTHGRSLERASPGSRTAANVVGVQKDEVERGEALVVGGWMHPSTTLDVQVRLLPQASRPVSHADEVHFFCTTFDCVARLRLLEGDVLAPGEEQWAQVLCSRPAPLTHGDRFILRSLSPSETIGGGTIVDAHPGRRHRRRDPEVLGWLAALQAADKAGQAVLKLHRAGLMTVEALGAALDLTVSQAGELARSLVSDGRAVLVTDSGSPESSVVAEVSAWERMTAQALAEVSRYHEQHHLRPGMPREELRRRLRLRQAPFAAALDRWLATGQLATEGDRVKLPEWQVVMTSEERARAGRWIARLREAGASGVTLADLGADPEDDLLHALMAQGEVRRLPDDVLIAGEVYAAAVRKVTDLLRATGGATVAEVRDALSSNRRATLALLADLDDAGITRRQGDLRVPGRRFPNQEG